MNSDFKNLLNLFNELGVRYLIIGGYALIRYAEPRYTKDLDVLIATDPSNAHAVYDALKQFGAPLEDIGVETFMDEELFYQMGRPPARIDILMSIPGIDFQEAWQNRQEFQINGSRGYFISRDDLIKSKLASGRPSDLLDAEALEQSRDESA